MEGLTIEAMFKDLMHKLVEEHKIRLFDHRTGQVSNGNELMYASLDRLENESGDEEPYITIHYRSQGVSQGQTEYTPGSMSVIGGGAERRGPGRPRKSA